tara:strand:- start:52 stop:549 length:498 start_codon:yes stop_codon:yes gene_type:complete
MDNDKKGIGDNSIRYEEDRYEGMLDQAVRFLDKLCNLVISADTTLTKKAINGKNNVVRYNGVRAVSTDMQKLVKETKSWHAVIETMKRGKDVHIQENCKSEKLDIVGGEAHDFGQYLINKSDGKFCQDYPIDVRGNRAGHKYINKVTDETTEPYNANELKDGKYE